MMYFLHFRYANLNSRMFVKPLLMLEQLMQDALNIKRM